MAFEDYLNVMLWMDVRVCFPFALLAVGLCCMAQLDNVPVVHYLNLLAANLIQLITLIVAVVTQRERSLNLTCVIIYCSVAMVSLYFRVIIAVERCFLISCPQLNFFRQTKASVIICALVWVICLVTFPLLIFFKQEFICFVFALLPSPTFIILPIGTFIHLPRATLVSAEGKRRIVGTFVLLLVNNAVTIIPPVIRFIYYPFSVSDTINPETQNFLTLLLLSPFLDLFLLVFLREGPVDQLLSGLCCCKMETSAQHVLH